MIFVGHKSDVGIGMLKRFKEDSEEIGDDSTNELMNKGVYRLEEKGKKRLKAKPYSFWSAVKAISLLSILLWWLPAIGQIIAGYVGGRRAPSPWKAALAAIIPVSIIFGIMYAHDHGILTAQISVLYNLPSSIASGIASIVTFTAPYITFISNYLSALIDLLNSTIALWLSGFLVTIVFAYVGGLSSLKERNELEFKKKFSMLLPQSLKRNYHVVYTSVTPSSWYARNDQRLGALAKIGAHNEGAEEMPVLKKRKVITAKAPNGKVRVIRMESLDEDDSPTEETKKEPRYAKNALNERLVTRALAHYEQSKARGIKKRV